MVSYTTEWAKFNSKVEKVYTNVILQQDVYRTKLIPNLIINVDNEFSDESDSD